jgi:hypothetical protein
MSTDRSYPRPNGMRQGLLVAVVAGVLVGSVSARPRSDDNFLLADAHLEKAAALVQAASCGAFSDKAVAECERHVKKALDAIADARTAAAAAAVASDGGH